MASPAAASLKWPESSRSFATTAQIELQPDLAFIDVGCGDGRSTRIVRKKLKIAGTGLGIDRFGPRLPTSTLSGIKFMEADLLALPNKKQCQFVTMFNVLPSTSGYAAAFDLLRKACMICRDFVYVSQPNFDSGPYLLRLGLKTHYSGATANRFQGTTVDYYRMAETLMEQGLIQDYSIIESGRIHDSSDDAIHPLQTPPDSGRYNPTIHRYKSEDIVFPDPLFRRIQIILARKPSQLTPITKRLSELDDQDNLVISSAFK